MSRIWVPEGNKEQTEIDIAISQLQYSIHQLESERQYHQYEALKVISLLEEVQYGLKYLNDTLGVVISIQEYQAMILEEKRYKKTLDLLRDMIHDCNELIELQKKQIGKLSKQRAKAATKILQFKGRSN